MPVHRIARRANADVAKAGFSAQTSGIATTATALATRNVNGGDIVQVSHDGSTVMDLVDGKWSTKTIVDGSATSLADIACAASAMSGGFLHYMVEASDGTDFQAMTGLVQYAMVDKAGTKTLTITNLTTVDAKAVSSGTLTLAWTFVTGTGKGTIKLQPTGSLTETTPYRVTFLVVPIRGAVTLL